MAVNVATSAPKSLLDSIYSEIDDGAIETWSYDEDGDFSHVTSDGQWEGKAWLHPEVKAGKLVLGIIPPQSGTVTEEVYAVYHGRFIEMLLAHFDDGFSEVTATAQATTDDSI